MGMSATEVFSYCQTGWSMHWIHLLRYCFFLSQNGTIVTINSLFSPLPVRRKEFERISKREFGPRAATNVCFGSVLLRARDAFDCQQPDGQRVCRVIN